MTTDVSQIGRCTTCERTECIKPKARDMYPEQGCADWQTAESKKFKRVPLIKVEPLKD